MAIIPAHSYVPLLLLIALISGAKATVITVHNQCGYNVCAKYWVPNNGVGGGCQALSPGGSWQVTATPSWSAAVMWAISNTGCANTACNTGPPSGVTLFEITVDGSGNNDYYDISTLSGYNIRHRIVPSVSSCPTVDCAGTTAALCPNGYYAGGPDATKACSYGTNYDLYLC